MCRRGKVGWFELEMKVDLWMIGDDFREFECRIELFSRLGQKFCGGFARLSPGHSWQ